VGIVGAGRIGTAYARMMVEGHKMDLVYYDPYPNKFLEEYIRRAGAGHAGRPQRARVGPPGGTGQPGGCDIVLCTAPQGLRQAAGVARGAACHGHALRDRGGGAEAGRRECRGRFWASSNPHLRR
jgi:hypothetical protein